MAPTATGTSTSTTPAAAAVPSTASTSVSVPGSLEEATQRYQSTKLAVRTGLANKRIIDRSLIDLESQIYLFEGSYLQSTSSSGGNIVKGFDAYLKNSSTGSTGRASAVVPEVPVEDRIFSLSSATYQKSLEQKANEGLVGEEERESAGNTPKKTTDDAATPTGKKKKDKDATPAIGKEGVVKKKKDKEEGKGKDKERSMTPNLKSTGGGKNATESGSAGGTPTKTGGGKAVAGGTATKLKRKNTDGAGSGAVTPTAKVAKRKKDDD
ncbi:Histone H4 acetyltransferase, NuA4 complex, Eaf6 [Kalmanozyma brasiliensis GHG001]|uniref:Chromatin modification-related protein EAF6 n=1 Tax=Kalmanozyma brasiliensis (strain GHG001) TaxID=1365824 RepID=V5GTV9_KALBG|nr:Histone H4 acetyltransferase, NuA4 complex, Eaf6 [Kalmanozyma brasiliensis GHG001]EST09347.1 Histone H4 acetyltransferase, NuA4 complex, Eaf6 [Kalmanozyma brasiliensis GHG001]